MIKPLQKRPWKPSAEFRVFCTLLFSGGLIRILSAWRYRHTLNLDAGVVALMAKHISEGRHFPTFFYGQPHMGSLEAFISALFCRLFGVSGFAVNLGTAALSWGLLPVVYFWARNAAGKRAAWMATAFCIIGPHGFFHYNGSPRGGYAGAIVFGAAVTYLATRMAIRWRLKKEQTHADFLWLGLAAGVGWWSSQLVTAALLSAALLLLIAMGRHAFSLRIGTGLFGFFLGGLPFWIYNLRNDMATFRFAEGLGSYSVSSGLRRLVLGRVNLLFSPEVPSEMLKWSFILLVLGILTVGMVLWIRALIKHDTPLGWTFGGILLYTGIFSLLFTQSHLSIQPTPRYLLPLVAPLGVWCGVVLSKTDKRLAAVATGILVLIPSGFILDRSFPQNAAAWHRSTLQAGEALRELNLRTVYAPITFRSWNFILGESVAVVDLNRSVFPGQTAQAELDPDIGVLGDAGNLNAFLRRAGVTGRHQVVGNTPLVTDFHGPEPATSLDPDTILSVRDTSGREVREVLLDRDVSTAYQVNMTNDWEELTLSLRSPQALAGLRFWPARPTEVPAEIEVLVREQEQGEWMTVQAATAWSGFFWSADRLYWEEPYFRLQIRFPVVSAGQIKIRFRQRVPGHPVSISQLDVLATGDASPLPTDWSAVLRTLDEENVTQLIADRGESVKVHRETNGRISTPLRKDAFPDSLPVPPYDLMIPEGAAVLVHETEAPRIAEALRAAGDDLRQVSVGGARLWIAEEDVLLPGRIWKGCDIWEHPARLGEWLWENGEREAALAKNPYLVEPPELEAPFTIHFDNGLSCLGARDVPGEVTPGSAVTLTTYWRLPEGELPDVRNLAVFAHWRSGTERFTSDEVLLPEVKDVYLEVPPQHRTFPMTVRFRVPEDLPEGQYDLWMGLYHPVSGKRVGVRTSLPTDDQAVRIPLFLKVSQHHGEPRSDTGLK